MGIGSVSLHLFSLRPLRTLRTLRPLRPLRPQSRVRPGRSPANLYDSDLALGALNACIKYQQLYSKDEYHGRFDLSYYKMNDYVRLDVAAMKALSVLPQNSGSATIALNYEVTSILEIID